MNKPTIYIAHLCIFCEHICEGRGYSDRYMGIQGSFEDDLSNVPEVLSCCDICHETHKIDEYISLGEYRVGVIEIGKKKFKIDSTFRMND